MSILNSFPQGFQPRPNQEETLLNLEKNWELYDIHIINEPVACGKSLELLTLAEYAGSSNIIVPNNLLLKQYQKTIKNQDLNVHKLDNTDSYKCKRNSAFSCKKINSFTGGYCSQCQYAKDKVGKHYADVGVYTYHSYLANKMYKTNLLIDESHLITPMLRELHTKKYWFHKFGFPDKGFDTVQEILDWLSNRVLCKNLAKLKNVLGDETKAWHIRQTTALYRGKKKKVMVLKPFILAKERPFLWPPRVRKIVLASATISNIDIELLGLDKRRVNYIDAESIIPAERRPYEYLSVADMSHTQIDTELPKIADAISGLMRRHLEKGIIHCPYSLTPKLWSLLKNDPQAIGRMMFHTKWNKQDNLDRFMRSPPDEGKILLASGMYEGISLDDDLARWQAIVKAPFLSLMDPSIRHYAEHFPHLYKNETIKLILQSYGRVCRGPMDYGMTYFLDKRIEVLMKNNLDSLPKWFKEAEVR